MLRLSPLKVNEPEVRKLSSSWLTFRNQDPGQVALPGGKADSSLETPFQTARREANEEIGLPSDDSKLPSPFRVEHLCQLPTNLAKTELAVRPCVAFLHSSGRAGQNDADAESKLIPKLDPKEVAVVFTASFFHFLVEKCDMTQEQAQRVAGVNHSWYRGNWTDWHDSRWRMHNFYVPMVSGSVTRAKDKSKDQDRMNPAGHQEKPEMAMASTVYRVFGMTARILVDAARLAYGQEPEFEHNSHFGDEDMIDRLQQLGTFGKATRGVNEVKAEGINKTAKI